MAQYVYQYDLTVPAGTPKSSPATAAVPVNNLRIERVEIEVPHGPAGRLGFQIFNSGNPWKPDAPGDWLVWDGKTDGWWLNDQPTGSMWELVGYNTGQHPHTIYSRWLTNPLPTPAPLDVFVPVRFETSDVADREIVVL